MITRDEVLAQEDGSRLSPPKLLLTGIFILVVALAGGWIIGDVASRELARDEQHWQDKLNLIADSRAEEVQRWVDGRFEELRALADNPSLQLYLSELQAMPEAKRDAMQEPAQMEYLRHALTFTAERGGFVSARNKAVQSIPANVTPGSIIGVALQDHNNRNVVSSSMRLPEEGEVAQSLADMVAGSTNLVDLSKQGDEWVLGFVVPVYGIQGERNEAGAVGRVIGFQDATPLFSALPHPGVTEQTLETVLLRERGENVQNISPLKDGAAPLEKSLKADFQTLAEAAAIRKPGTFIALQDARGNPVFATSRQIAHTPWTLIVKIDQSEALQASHSRQLWMKAMFGIVLAVVMLAVLAAWRQASLMRSRALQQEFRQLAQEATNSAQLLRLVSDHQPEEVYIIDAQARLQFANAKTADEVRMSPQAVVGKRAADVFGTARADHILADAQRAMQSQQQVVQLHSEQDGAHVTRAAYIPLEHIPLSQLPNPSPGVLVVEQDVSELVNERERRLNTLRQLIDTLVYMVDRRDPHAANHSRLIALLCTGLSDSLQLPPREREAAEIAGKLVNVGKVVVPEQMLNKAEMLSEDERKSIRESVLESAQLLSTIPFDGPVVETLRQSLEHWDGTGIGGLRGEEILLPARLIAVARAFVGMVSARAYRNALPIEHALKRLFEQSGTLYDPKITAALADYIENRGGRSQIESIQKRAA